MDSIIDALEAGLPKPRFGSVCPKCGERRVIKEASFFSTRTGYMPGLVCKSCNSLWEDPENSFLEAYAKASDQLL